MSQTLASVQTLIAAGDVQVTSHGDDELAKDQISLRELLDTVQSAVVVEDYPTYAKGPCVLVLQHDASGRPVHVVWGIRKDQTRPAMLVTAYRPDPQQWSDDFL